ncbi:MAG: hypothetical protein LBP59_00435 [Planctomycetaceae bacterium]|nr:hypothetical protein [Planctomycetaceae bacterium]
MSEVLITSAFLFAWRQSAGGTPAIRWSRMLFRIAGVSPAILLKKIFLICVICGSF